MTKLYFVRTNAYDMILADDGHFRKILTEANCCDLDFNAGDENPEERALEILKTVEDDSGWDFYDEPVDELIDSDIDEILATLEWGVTAC